MTNREIVKNFCATRWSDQKLAEIYAFNEDGKMRYSNCLICLLGLDATDSIPAIDVFSNAVYNDEIKERINAYKVNHLCYHWVEQAYHVLGSNNQERQPIFGEILREIMQERETAKDSEKVLDKAPQLALV